MTAKTNTTADHPAKWSAKVLDAMADAAAAEAERVGHPLLVLDPFAGVGRARLAEALGSHAERVDGIELQPEWSGWRPGYPKGVVDFVDGVPVPGTGDLLTLQGQADDLPPHYGDRFDAVITSPCYGNRMADHHDAQDRCKACDGKGAVEAVAGHCFDIDGGLWHLPGECKAPECGYPERPARCCPVCSTCHGTGLSWRNTYAHALRRAGGELVPGSAAAMHWGCVTPDTRVLRGDWRWVAAGDLRDADPIIGFDEEIAGEGTLRHRGRRLRHGTIDKVEMAKRPCVAVYFDDGSAVVSTVDHPWLARRPDGPAGYVRRWEWTQAGSLQAGDALGVFMPEWRDDRSWEAGWLAGMFDGEGSLGRDGMALTVSQKTGATFDQLCRLLKARGVSFAVNYVEKANCVRVQGGITETAALLGSIRPERLLAKLNVEGRAMRCPALRRVVKVEDVGDRDVVLMGTTCGTYFAAGMGSHNTKYRLFHRDALAEMIRVVVPGGLLAINMSNHIADGDEQDVVGWWVNQIIVAGCILRAVLPINTPRNRNGANAHPAENEDGTKGPDPRVDAERLILAHTPKSRRLL